jgi:hypothetical protein
MGLSHLKGLIKLHVKIFIVDTSIKKITKKLKENKIYNENKIEILYEIPKNIHFDLCIISTKSAVRFNIFKKFLNFNTCKIILLEKFPFLKSKHFNYAKKIFDLKKIYINTWAYYLADYITLKSKTNFKMKISVRSQLCLTNITHFLHFFFKLDEYSNIISREKKIKVIKLDKDRKYNEIDGYFTLKTFNGNSFKIKTFRNPKFPFYLKIINNNNSYNIYFTNNAKILIKKNNKKKIITFPFSSKNTKMLFNKNLVTRFPNLEIDKKISVFVLSFITNRII